ncbi:MAG TPA: hypothetical protein PLQ36_04005, partial [Candidatus Gracilibacteria bacterium]|nr:hypothetical protein [Candidatus Gracilibacteria bacterium]
LRAIAGDAKVTLSWDPEAKAHSYLVKMGIRSQSYERTIYHFSSASSLVIPDLMNNFPYYFSLEAYDLNNVLLKTYPEIRVIPSGAKFSIQNISKIPLNILRDFSRDKQIKGQTGPEDLWWIALTFGSALMLFFWKKGQKKALLNLNTQSAKMVKPKLPKRMHF